MKERIPSIIIIISVIIIIIMGLFGKYMNVKKLEIEVKDKYVKNYNDTSKYIVVDKNNNSYEVTDLLLRFKFNSTDIYNKLEKNRKYKIEISGFRIPFLSSYPNINKVEE